MAVITSPLSVSLKQAPFLHLSGQQYHIGMEKRKYSMKVISPFLVYVESLSSLLRIPVPSKHRMAISEAIRVEEITAGQRRTSHPADCL